MKKYLVTLLLILIILIPLSALGPIAPPVPWLSYNYGIWDTSIPGAPVYEPDNTVNGFDLGIGALNIPNDLCRDNNGNIYILDAGNFRVIVLTPKMELIKVIDDFSDSNGSISLIEPQGIYVDKSQKLFLADRGAHCVYIFNMDGVELKKIVKPVSDLIDDKTEFLPNKVLTDPAGVIYVLSFGSYEGAYTFDQNGDFLGFFGSNKVSVNQKLLTDRFWRNFATKDQRDRMYRFVPVEYANFAIDEKGFVYTVSNFGDNEQPGQVRKLNPLSQNILFAGQKPNLMFFGDWESTWTNRVEKSSLIAIDIDKDNFINVLDFERGRIFQYNQDCNLLAIFGGSGNQEGSFRTAADIVSSNGKIFVLDNTKGNLTAFKLTRYGEAIHKATILYEDGFYKEALEPWYDALKIDRNGWLTLRGIGRAYERLGDYEKAMDFYKQSVSHQPYSEAFHEYRTSVLRRYFAIFIITLVLLLCMPSLISFIKQKLTKNIPIQRTVFVSKLKFPFYLVLHPFKGWEEIKHEKQESLWISNVIIFLWFICSILEYQFVGFQFNNNKLDEMNIFVNLASTVGFVLFLSIANWGVCTLQDGKGTFREIWIYLGYSQLTRIITTIPVIILSNIMTMEEGIFLSAITAIINAWVYVQMIMAVKAAHQYTLKKTIASIFLTIIGVMLMLIIIMLFVSLFTQMYSFIETIVQEIMMRS